MTTAAGVGMEFIGFDEPRLTIFNHKPRLNDHGQLIDAPGKAITTLRVVDPDNMVSGEFAYLVDKQLKAGFMPWPPGEECFKHPFPIWPRDRLTRGTAAKGRPMGCPACREALSQTNERLRAAAAEVQAPSVESASIASAAPPKVGEITTSTEPLSNVEVKSDNRGGIGIEVLTQEYKCLECGYEPRLTTKKGKRYGPSQRRAVLSRHLGTHTN